MRRVGSLELATFSRTRFPRRFCGREAVAQLRPRVSRCAVPIRRKRLLTSMDTKSTTQIQVTSIFRSSIRRTLKTSKSFTALRRRRLSGRVRSEERSTCGRSSRLLRRAGCCAFRPEVSTRSAGHSKAPELPTGSVTPCRCIERAPRTKFRTPQSSTQRAILRSSVVPLRARAPSQNCATASERVKTDTLSLRSETAARFATSRQRSARSCFPVG